MADAWTKATRFDVAHPLWLRSLVEYVEATDEWRADQWVTDQIILRKYREGIAAIRSEQQRVAAAVTWIHQRNSRPEVVWGGRMVGHLPGEKQLRYRSR
jgi:hypothetical protein